MEKKNPIMYFGGKGRLTLPEKCLIDPQRECLGIAQAAILEKRIEALEDWQKDSKKFHNTFYDWQREQIARDARLDVKLSGMEANIEKMVEWQESQQCKPQHFLDEIKGKIVWAVLAALITLILARVGL